MVHQSETPLTVGQLWDAVYYQRGKALLAFAVLMLIVLVVFLAVPRQYGSEGKLFVQLGRTNVGLDPTATTSGTISINDSRETEIRSVVELLRSRATAELVVDRVGAERILDSGWSLPRWLKLPSLPKMPWHSAAVTGELSSAQRQALWDRERAVRKLHNDLSIEAEKKTSVVTVYGRASSPQLARQIVQAVLDAYRELHLQVHTIEGSREFFDEQFARQQQELVAAEQALRDFRNERKVLTVAGARDSLQTIISRLEGQLVDVEIDLAQANRRIAELDGLLTGIDRRIDRPTTGIAEQSTESAQQEMFRLESERARLLARYSDQHPRVTQINQQIARLENQLAGIPTERTQTLNDVNPVYQELEIELIQARAGARALESRLADVRAKYAQAQEDLQQLNEDQLTSDQLQRGVAVAQTYMDVYAQKRGEAQVLDQLDKQHISNVVIAQNATLMLKHVSPRGSIVLPLGMVFALLGAVVMALLADRRWLRSEVENGNIEQSLELPVLVTLPRVSSSRAVHS